MKKILYILLLAAPSFAQVIDQPVATVKLTRIVSIGERQLRELAQKLEEQLGRPITSSEKEDLLNAEIDNVLLNQAATRANVRVTLEMVNQFIETQRRSTNLPLTDREFREYITRETGFSYKEYEDQVRQLLSQEMYVRDQQKQLVQSTPTISSQEIEQFYEENATFFSNPALIRVDHLFWDTRSLNESEQLSRQREADSRLREITSGTRSFSQLMEFSLDDPDFLGEDMGYLARGNDQQIATLGADFVNAVFALEDDEISTLLKSNIGYHIVRVTDKRAPKLLGLDDPVLPGEQITVRRQIRSYIENQKLQLQFQKAVQAEVGELKREAEIRIFRDSSDW